MSLLKKKTNGSSLNVVNMNLTVYHSNITDEEVSVDSISRSDDVKESKMGNDESDDTEPEESSSQASKLKKILNDVIFHEKNIKRNIKRLQKEYNINHSALQKAENIKKLLHKFDNDKVDEFSKYEDKRKLINGLLDSFQALLLQTDLEQIRLKQENKKLKKRNKILTQKLEITAQNEMILAQEYQNNILHFDEELQKYKDKIDELQNSSTTDSTINAES